MESLPMAPATCSLDGAELRAQLARYRAVGAGADLLQRSGQQLVIRVADPVPDLVVEALVGVERHCCPFFDLAWEHRGRRLSISVPRPEEKPALDAIAYALGFSNADRGSQDSA
jgi:hypothetical protein